MYYKCVFKYKRVFNIPVEKYVKCVEKPLIEHLLYPYKCAEVL